MSTTRQRAIPAVDKVLQALGATALPRSIVVAAVRRALAAWRSSKHIPEFEGMLKHLNEALLALRRARIQPVINATGILVHTNLGRSPMGGKVAETLTAVATQYNNLEFDLGLGSRGSRASYLEHGLALLCRAESATVVNNCAAALVLILRHCTADKPEVVISRGELIQIGGGFRIPEILEASGARLREVGTTNKTSLNDYARAIGKETGLILKVHRSNFFMSGFVESPTTEELAVLARKRKVPLAEDLGSGAVVATERYASIGHEPTPAEVLHRGVDVVCFSGDKLLGGPQAGIIAGRSKLVANLKKDPFFRALRCDKLILAALQTTVEHYLDSNAETPAIPILEMLSQSEKKLQERAERLIAGLSGLLLKVQTGHAMGQLGGGTLPQAEFPSVTVDLQPSAMALTELAARLRETMPPVIGCIAGGRLRLDLRTVFPHQDPLLVQAIRQAMDVGSGVRGQ